VFWQSERLPVEQQAWPNHGSSLPSVVPALQSLSSVSQSSAAGVTWPEQTLVPLAQVKVPDLQSPTPAVPAGPV
jgi:hypothetical protein